MKKTLYCLLPLFLILHSCNKMRENSHQGAFHSDEILNHQLSKIIESITFQGKEKTSNSDTLFFYLHFFNRNDSNFLSINYDISPPLFFFGYNGFIGFNKYKESYLVVVNSIQDSIPEKFINTNLLIHDSIEYKKLETKNHLSDVLTYEYHIRKDFSLHSNDSVSARLYRVGTIK